jgi:hypothetical protein
MPAGALRVGLFPQSAGALNHSAQRMVSMLKFVAGLVLGLLAGLVLAIRYPQEANRWLDLLRLGH